MGEGKSWVEEKGQDSGARACSEAVRGTIMITGHWWRTLKGWQPRHPPHNNVGSSSESHLVGPVCFASAACLHSINNTTSGDPTSAERTAQDTLSCFIE